MSNDWGFISGVATYGVQASGSGTAREVTVDVQVVSRNPKPLSRAAVSVLIDTGTSRIGAVAPGPRDGSPMLTELYVHGLIGPERGLTRAGSIRREREIARRLDEAF